MRPVDGVLQRLPGHRQVGPAQFEARCPAHEDNRASLSVSEGNDHRVLLRCHAGCAMEKVVKALGMAPRDLFNGKTVERQIVATYDYKDESGQLLFQVVRYEPKDFRQRRPDGAGGWVQNTTGVRKVLYQLPELRKACGVGGAEVWVVEGEKDVETLRRHGLIATCNPGGAGKWRPEYSEALRGAGAAYVVPDADQPGRTHAAQVAQALLRVLPLVKVVELPAGSKDVTEWFGKGGQPAELKALAEKLPLLPLGGGSGSGNSGKSPEVVGSAAARNESRPLFETLAEFMARTKDLPQPSWLIPDLIPDSGRVLVVSAPNAGKTLLALVMAKAAAATWRPTFLVLEEGGPRQMHNRFQGMGLPAEAPIHVAHLRGVHLADEAVRAYLVEQVTKATTPPVLVLDPVASIFTGDENDTKEMNRFKAHLDELARANSQALIVLLHHNSKAAQRGESTAIHAGRGSSVLAGWADCQLNLDHVPTPKGSGLVSFTAHVAKMRDGERGFRCEMTVALGTGEVSTKPLVDEVPPAKKEKAREVLAESGALTRTELARRIGGNAQQSFEVINALIKDGVVELDLKKRCVLRPEEAADA